MNFNKEQKQALEAIKEWANGSGPGLISLTGAAGTGKTSLIIEAKNHIRDVQYSALTGRAALRLSEAADVKATTLHAALYLPPHLLKRGELEFNRLRAPTGKYLVIDESSMITPKIYNDLKQWVKFHGTRILFVGDSFQLPPILTEDEKEDDDQFTIFSHVKGPELIKVMRSDGGIIDVATIIREEERVPTKSNTAYKFVDTPDPLEYVIGQYLKDPDDHMLITWRNKLRMEANCIVRKKLGHTSHLPDENEPIMICRNGQGLLNGEIMMVKKMVPGPILEGVITYRVLLDDRKYVLCSITGKEEFMDGFAAYIKNWKGYLKAKRQHNVEDPLPITYGYCGTAHKCQGNEWRRVSIALERKDLNNPYFGAPTTLPNGKKVPFGIRWLYTSITRSKEKAILAVG